MSINQEDLKEILFYNQETGVFTWKRSIGRKTKIGCFAGSTRKDGYVLIRIHGKRYLAHRLSWLYVYGVFPSNHIDHINGNTSDNRINNLREVSVSGNMQNRRRCNKNNKNKFLGVTFDKRKNMFMSQICINRKNKFIGYFETKEEAHSAYLREKRNSHKTCTI
jgi:hypothetical protein